MGCVQHELWGHIPKELWRRDLHELYGGVLQLYALLTMGAELNGEASSRVSCEAEPALRASSVFG